MLSFFGANSAWPQQLVAWCPVQQSKLKDLHHRMEWRCRHHISDGIILAGLSSNEKAFRCQSEKSFLLKVLTQPLYLMNLPKSPSLSHWRFFCLLKLLLQEAAPNVIEMHMLFVLNSNQGIHHIPWELEVIIRHNVWQWCSRSAIGSESKHPQPTLGKSHYSFRLFFQKIIHRLAFHHSQYSMHPF